MDDHSDEVTFLSEPVEQNILESIEGTLKESFFDDSKVQGWVDEIISKVNKDLVELNKPFKYIVTCVVMQNNGAGLHLANSQYWDRDRDVAVVLRWPAPKSNKKANTRCVCIVTVYGVAY